MKVAARCARINDRINTSVDNRFGAWQTPECVGRKDKEERRSEKRENHLVSRKVENKEQTTAKEMHLWMLAYWSNLTTFILSSKNI